MPEVSFSKQKDYYPLRHLDAKGLVCAFSPRDFKNMSLSCADTRWSLNNRDKFLSGLGIDYRYLVCAKQIHASSVRCVKEKDKGRGALSYDSSIADTDALITDKRDLPLAVFTADCLPIFLYDPITPAIGLIHAGWRSTKENIAAKTIQLMEQEFNTKASNLYAGFGPALRSCCYEVAREFNNIFAGNLIRKDNRYYLDLARVNKQQILDSGVKEENIFDSGICTSCRNEDFFSYRKEEKNCGRMMSVVMLR